MKLALIGQDIAPLLPSMLTDLYQAHKADADLWIEEKNDVMQEVLLGYAHACLAHSGLSGSVHASHSRREILEGADCVIYAGDCMVSSRFRQDREALLGQEDGDAGLSDQARVNGGLGGLMHTLRQGSIIVPLCEDMRKYCPSAIVISLGQPVARTTELFALSGFAAYGIGNSARRGPGGIDGFARKLGVQLGDVQARWRGLTGFQFLTALRNRKTGEDYFDRIRDMTADGAFGRMPRRWLQQYGAVCVGSGPEHAEFMEAQEDFIPDANPTLAETVEHRKDRILQMNTVREKGLDDPDGKIAQLTLLTRTPSERPISLALALLEKGSLVMPGVTMRNETNLALLPRHAFIESTLCLTAGERIDHTYTFPSALTDLMGDIAQAHHLAALAATGDRSSLREYVETDPALSGLDRLYLVDVVSAMIRMHNDILFQFNEDMDEE
ncbi:MAG: hypothetical protein IJ246_08345 [Clostridia bacterium]|nr:hypothetical protein [Clostridia bacterium]